MADSILGRFVWHELMSADDKAAGKFFAKVIGWTLKPWGQDGSYTMFMAGKSGMGGLMALPSKDAPPMWMTYVATPDINATVAKATSLGGKVLKPVAAIPTIGQFAVMQDPQGAVFAPFQPEGAPAGALAPPGELDFSWHELATTDAPAALKFYADVFGWIPTEAMDMGPTGMYHMFGLGGRTMGGMFTKSKEMPGPASWLAYIRVKDAKKTARAIASAGGTVINGPMEVPGGDWIVQALDPQGVMFAVHSVAAKAAPASRKRSARTASPARKTARKAASKAARSTGTRKETATKKTVTRKAASKKAASKKAASKRPIRKAARNARSTKKAAPRRRAGASKQRAARRPRR